MKAVKDVVSHVLFEKSVQLLTPNAHTVSNGTIMKMFVSKNSDFLTMAPSPTVTLTLLVRGTRLSLARIGTQLTVLMQ